MLLEGELDFYAGDGWDTFPTIGGVSIHEELEKEFDEIDFSRYDSDSQRFKVMLGADPVAEGRMSAWTGWVGTDVTPGDPPEMFVGGVDVLRHLRELDGRTVALSVELADG